MRIMNNIASLNAWRNLTATDTVMNKSLERLSSGLRINRAADDAAGLAISEKMRSQIRGVNQAMRNASDGISLIQTAEGALQEMHSILQRMRELAVQSSSDTLTDADRTEIQKEVDNLKKEIDRIANATEFNTKKLLNGNVSEAVAARGTQLQSVKLTVGTVGAITGASAAAAVDFSAGAQTENQTFQVRVDEGTWQTITLNGNYADATAVKDAVQTAIDANATLAGKVTATLDANDKVVFTRTQAGADYSVQVKGDATQWEAAAAFNRFDFSGVNNGDFDIVLDPGGATPLTVNVSLTTDYTAAPLNDTWQQQVIDDINADITAAGHNDKVEAYLVGTDTIGLRTKGSYATADVRLENSNANAQAQLQAPVAGTTYQNALNAINLTSALNYDSGIQAGQDGTSAVTSSTLLVRLFDENGASFTLQSGDTVNIVGYVDGVKKTGTYTVTATSTLQNLADQVETVLGTANVEDVQITSDGQVKLFGRSGKDYALADVKLSVSGRTQFNNRFGAFEETQSARDAQADNALNFHIGANAGQSIRVGVSDMRKRALALDSADVSSEQGASTAITMIDSALNTVSAQRAALGAVQNRLEHTINNLNVQSENLTASESRIRDADMAAEMSAFTRNQILIQAGTAMMAQANVKTQAVLQLLR